jgi:hypothetical protein
MEIFIHRDGQQFGPYPEEIVREYLATGNVLTSDWAWHAGAANWMPLSELMAATPAPAIPAFPAETAFTSSATSIVESTGTTAGSAPPIASPSPRRAPLTQPLSALAHIAAQGATPGSPGGSVDKALALLEKKKTGFESESGKDVKGIYTVNSHARGHQSLSSRNISLGVLWCLGGAAVIIFSYAADASGVSSAAYVVSSAAILYGSIQVLRGVIQYFQK